jgi:hypothetical protein
MMKELGTIRAALSLNPSDVKNGNAGAIERVAAITLEEIEETSPFAAGRAVQS